MKTRLRRGTVSFALGLICSSANAADMAGSVDVAGLEEVVVTATRVKATLADVPAAVTVVNAKEIQNKNASRLGDALDQVPSMYLRGGALGQSQGTIGTSGMSLRGVDQNKTLILLDGQPIQDASSGKVNWRIPFLEDIERVEVVPGAFSSLYGSNAIGGVVSIITKQPDRHELTAKVKKGWKDASGEDASVYWREKLNNGFGIVVGYGQQRRDSYVNEFVVKAPSCPPAPAPCTPGTPITGAQAITTREGVPTYLVGDLGTTPWNSTNGTVKLFYNLNATDKIYTGINHQETRVGYTQFNTYLRDAVTGAPVSSGTLGINGQRVVLTEYDFSLWSYAPLHEADTRYFAGYETTLNSDYLLKLDLGKIERAYSFTLADPASTWNSGSGKLSDTPNRGFDGTAQLTFQVGSRQVVVTGLALHKDSVNQQIYALSNWRDPDTRTTVNSTYNGSSTTTSLFAQDEISAADALTVYLGGRMDKWETKGDNSSAVAPIGSNTFPTRSVSAFSPKLSAVYRATESSTVRASFGRSFRAPANQDLYTSSTSRGRTTTGDPNLQPERGTTWEVGGELGLGDEARLTATYYDTLLTNLIYVRQDSPTQSTRINAGKARIRGVELAASNRLTSWLELDINYAYIDSKMLENSTDPLSVGKRLTDSPKNIAGVGLTAEQGSWTGTLNARYVSHIFWTAQNTDTVEGVPGSYDSHTIVNGKLGYDFSGNMKGNLAINNLFNRKAYSYFLMPGRTLTAEIVLSF
ncbi:MAG: TonB-dependent receptor [Nitrosomonadales bacterium]|nr:TonB-dependent receptor [Nitrosomonadales bacterium]